MREDIEPSRIYRQALAFTVNQLVGVASEASIAKVTWS